MLKIIPLFCFSLVTVTFSFSQKSLKEIPTFGTNPGNLKMFIHADTLQTIKNKPLVLVLHGCTQNANDVAELTGWNKLADRNNFIVVYPQQKFLNNAQLCFNWFTTVDQQKNQRENQSIFEMIAYMQEHYFIDTNRIFITGLSAGAAMSVIVSAVYPSKIKAAAIFAGGAYQIATNPAEAMKAMLGKMQLPRERLISSIKDQNPNYNGQYPKIIIYQGKNDPIIAPENASLLVDQWTGVHNSDTIPDKIDSTFLGIKDITRKEYTDEFENIVVTLYEVDNLGHQLLIKPGNQINEGGETGIFGVDKGYHSTYQTAKEFGILKQE